MTRQSDADREALIAADPVAAEIMRFITDDVPSAMRLFPDMWSLMLADLLRQRGLVEVEVYTTEQHTVEGPTDVWTMVTHEIREGRTTHCGLTAEDTAHTERVLVDCTACLAAIAEIASPPFKR